MATTIDAAGVSAALVASNGNVVQAAIALTLRRTQLRQWLSAHGVDPRAFKVARAPRPRVRTRIRAPRVRAPGDHGVRRPGYYNKPTLVARVPHERVVHTELVGSLVVVITTQQIYLAHCDALADRATKGIALSVGT